MKKPGLEWLHSDVFWASVFAVSVLVYLIVTALLAGCVSINNSLAGADSEIKTDSGNPENSDIHQPRVEGDVGDIRARNTKSGTSKPDSADARRTTDIDVKLK